MKWLHLTNAMRFLTSRRGRDIFSHFTANKDDERDIEKKNIVALSVFIFLRPNIGRYQPGQFAYANAYLRDTYWMRASCELREVVELVCKMRGSGGPPAGWSRLRSAPLTRGLRVLDRVVPALFTQRNGRESSAGLLGFV